MRVEHGTNAHGHTTWYSTPMSTDCAPRRLIAGWTCEYLPAQSGKEMSECSLIEVDGRENVDDWAGKGNWPWQLS